jgi:alpha/beta hydrolase family protein
VTGPLAEAAHSIGGAVAAWERAVFGDSGRARGVPPGWCGPAAEAARSAERRLLERGGGLLDRARRLAAVLGDVAGAATLPLGPTEDARLTAALLAAARPGPAAAGAPLDGPAPTAVAHWWARLDAAERSRLTEERPELVGGLDGVPAADRDRANRRRLATARRDARAEEAALDAARGGVGGFGELQDLEGRLAAVRARLGRLAAVDAAAAGPGHDLLDLDPVSGRAAVAVGDVDHAGHVGVFVPGFTARPEDLPGRVGELDALAARAGPDTAVVAWYDYAAPQWSGIADPARTVLGTRPATDAAGRLASFLAGVDAARPGDPVHLTAIGHSYGTLTVAEALPAARGVDDVVLLGSPGVTPAPVRPGHVWVGEARGDPIADTGWFGPDPSSSPGVRVLATGAQPGTAGVRGHEAYLRPGSTSAAGVAAVVAGRPGDVVVDPTTGAGDRVRGLLGAQALRPAA